MIVNISNLLQRKVDIIPFEFEYSKEALSREDFELKLKSPLVVSGDAYYDGEIVSVKGDIHAAIEVQCSRCLKAFDYYLDSGFEEEFSKHNDDNDTYAIVSGEIDLMDMVIDVIILSMPLRMICSESCKGLCPVCGGNLNDEDCSCEKENVDPRLAVLKDLFKGD